MVCVVEEDDGSVIGAVEDYGMGWRSVMGGGRWAVVGGRGRWSVVGESLVE